MLGSLRWRGRAAVLQLARDGPQRARKLQASASLRPVTCRWPQENTAAEIAIMESLQLHEVEPLRSNPSPAARPDALARARARAHAGQSKRAHRRAQPNCAPPSPLGSAHAHADDYGLRREDDWRHQSPLRELPWRPVAPCVACCARRCMHVACCMLHLCFFGKHIYRLRTPLTAIDPVDP